MTLLWPEHVTSRIINGLLWVSAACLLVGILAINLGHAQELRRRVPLGSESVVAAMEGLQLPTQGVQVKMAAPIDSRTSNPQLEIQTIAMVNTHEMRLRMSCRNHSDCLPFYVTATYPEAVDPVALRGQHEPSTAATPIAAEHTEKSGVAISGTRPTVHDSVGAAPALKTGSQVTLQLDGERIHIQVEVVSLQSGSVGDDIRVSTHDHKQTYTAKIVTPTLLKGILQK